MLFHQATVTLFLVLASSSAGSASASASSSSLLDLYTTPSYKELAHSVASHNPVVLASTEKNLRHLDDDTQDAFRDKICGPYIADYVSVAPTATCKCITATHSIECLHPTRCQDNTGGCDVGQEVCWSTTTLSDYRVYEETEGVYVVTYAQLISVHETKDLQAGGASPYERARSMATETTCGRWYTLEGLEYECQSCTVCQGVSMGDEATESVDCSNIQPQAVDPACGTPAVNDTALEPFFDFCPAGGAPKPTTEGRAPASPVSGAGRSNGAAWGGLVMASFLAVAALVV